MVTNNTYFSKSLEKGLRVLSLFTKETPALTQTNISKLLGLNMTSTYRYINTLIEMGYIEKDDATNLIRPSIFCFAFCNNLMGATDYKRFIKAQVDEIHSRYNMTIDVAVCVEDTMMRIYNKEAIDTLTYILPDFTKSCLHNTALGKAYLSALPEDVLKKRVAKMELLPKTRKTITDHDLLLKDLMLAKKRGYAMNVEEYMQGLIAIAAPLTNPHTGKVIGGISFDFSILQRNIEEIEKQFVPVVIDLAKKISATLPPVRELPLSSGSKPF